MNPATVILASRSPRRIDLLRQMGVDFEIVPSEAEETVNDQLSPYELCQLNAYYKAREVAKRFPDAVILGADTMVCLEGEFFGKPTDLADAVRMLTALQGKTHQVVTGVCLLHLRNHRQMTFADTTDVTFLSLSRSQIRRYLDLVHCLDKAGAYAIQEHGEWVVSEISGSFSNVVGLPLEKLQAIFRKWDILPAR